MHILVVYAAQKATTYLASLQVLCVCFPTTTQVFNIVLPVAFDKFYEPFSRKRRGLSAGRHEQLPTDGTVASASGSFYREPGWILGMRFTGRHLRFLRLLIMHPGLGTRQPTLFFIVRPQLSVVVHCFVALRPLQSQQETIHCQRS